MNNYTSSIDDNENEWSEFISKEVMNTNDLSDGPEKAETVTCNDTIDNDTDDE